MTRRDLFKTVAAVATGAIACPAAGAMVKPCVIHDPPGQICATCGLVSFVEEGGKLRGQPIYVHVTCLCDIVWEKDPNYEAGYEPGDWHWLPCEAD